MSKERIIIAILAIALICSIVFSLAYFYYIPKMKNEIYAQGYNDGATNLIKIISNTGNIPIITNGTIQNIPIDLLCKNLIIK